MANVHVEEFEADDVCDECGSTVGIEGETHDGLQLCYLCFQDYKLECEGASEIEDETAPV